ncbi:MAG TPA: site-2 protease family protein [Blastocatellia bacterium]|jgi:Zn-dependent protease/CBS domain-containing protein|nr:site-2 protease family protein [Blastocatellia bacterium]
MTNGLKIGRILDIDVRIHWSWTLVFLLATWNLAAGVFPEWHPDWPAGLDWTIAVIAALLFFVSVLAHEFAHALVARARGLPVRRITLFLLGGVAMIDGEATSPGTEFVIAMVGPLTSIGLGIVFLALGMLGAGLDQTFVHDPVRVFGQLGPVSTLLVWLGPVNLLVGFFNLLPAFPLDGGRIMRSLLWGATKSLRKSTQWAAGVGRFVAWLFVLCGIAMIFGVPVPLFGAGLLGGMWLMFIGWFLSRTAQANYHEVRTRELLDDVPVYRLMRLDVPAVSPELPVNALVHDWIQGTDELTFPVIDKGQMVGVVALEDVHKVKRDSWETTVVGEIMTPTQDLAVVAPREPLGQALDKLSRGDLRQLPVVERGRLIGILRRVDVVKWLRLKSRLVPG